MANLWNIILCAVIISVVCVNCGPIKRSATDQQATDCYGTDCYYSPDYYAKDTIVNVNFPENISEVVLTFIPEMMERHEQQLRNMTTVMEYMAQNFQRQLTVLSNRLPIPPPPPKDCQDVTTEGPSYHSGIYTITPQDGIDSFQVYCDLETSGVGWTVFQRRFDGTVDFFLGWSEYVSGFGNVDGEYWLGLNHIYRMTRSGQWQLRIDMEAFDGDTAYAVYDSFSIGDALSNYQLHIGEYSGTAGDSLNYHNNMEFSTKDRDNDAHGSAHCAKTNTKGAWWYKSCAHSNLNALYLGPSGNSATANSWEHWKGYKSLKSTEMKMRRVG